MYLTNSMEIIFYILFKVDLIRSMI